MKKYLQCKHLDLDCSVQLSVFMSRSFHHYYCAGKKGEQTIAYAISDAEAQASSGSALSSAIAEAKALASSCNRGALVKVSPALFSVPAL